MLNAKDALELSRLNGPKARLKERRGGKPTDGLAIMLQEVADLALRCARSKLDASVASRRGKEQGTDVMQWLERESERKLRRLARRGVQADINRMRFLEEEAERQIARQARWGHTAAFFKVNLGGVAIPGSLLTVPEEWYAAFAWLMRTLARLGYRAKDGIVPASVIRGGTTVEFECYIVWTEDCDA